MLYQMWVLNSFSFIIPIVYADHLKVLKANDGVIYVCCWDVDIDEGKN